MCTHETAAMFELWVDFFISVMSTKNFRHIQYKRLSIELLSYSELQWVITLWFEMSFTLVFSSVLNPETNPFRLRH